MTIGWQIPGLDLVVFVRSKGTISYFIILCNLYAQLFNSLKRLHSPEESWCILPIGI
jgi:hypothetical protein